MLDNETKRKIDSARSILVGKVPDPKAQVEQITTALIYKFMDDMDRESEELGGVAKFVIGELESFKWAKLMSKELGGEARLILYTQALTAFSKAEGIPDIFRTIFKDAFLPYRDPETLNLFLKEIDYFDYDHSENLGDAFEYLLSVLGSQGDAGQFRTPRHIIDFIVEVLEPKKSDTILDPSCGTAGLLISAYKHISANENLSPVDKKQLMHNFTGYDISPDMVRLSLVNMYLHSFPQPKIYEYDTLTSEDRWNDSFDVILANPPFMTPKGGIRPHSRFSVQANRSEVLFVDYIAEHLNLNGRAGIIVPEGIIFQSANAYKALRKMLVETGFLWAVVSLPAGVFQPYSGVKTSILLLDRAIAKQSDCVLFVKISNDGYDLGAQRREIAHNDLIPALEIIKKHRKGETIESPIAQLVLKSKIAESGDYNLTGERYKENKAIENAIYPIVKLKDVTNLITCGVAARPEYVEVGIPFLSSKNVKNGEIIWSDYNQITYEDHKKLTKYNKPEKNDILYTRVGSFGEAAVIQEDRDFSIFVSLTLIKPIHEKINSFYLKQILNSDLVKELAKNNITGIGVGNLNVSVVREFEIPLPPLEIQNAIVAEIEQWQKVIDGAKQVVANYRPTISIQPDWEMVKLGDDKFFQIIDGDRGTNYPSKEEFKPDGYCLFLNTSNVRKGVFDFSKCDFTTKEKDEILRKGKLEREDVVLTTRGTLGNTAYYSEKIEFENIRINSGMVLLRSNLTKVSPKFLLVFLNSMEFENQVSNFVSGSAQPQLPIRVLSEIKISLPPIEIQNLIVEQIEKERAAVESCKTLIAMFEEKIKRKIGEVWGDV